MTDREYVLKLLYEAFLDIRQASHDHDYHKCFVLSDVFHNVPLQVNIADKGDSDYASIVTWIRERCEARKCTAWLENAANNIARLP